VFAVFSLVTVDVLRSKAPRAAVAFKCLNALFLSLLNVSLTRIKQLPLTAFLEQVSELQVKLVHVLETVQQQQKCVCVLE